MPVLTKINTNVIADNAVTAAKIPAGAVDADIQADAVTSAKIAPNITLTGDYVGIPSATTTERDALTGVVGMLIYNSTIGMLQQRNVSGWASIDSPPTLSSLNYPGDDTALDTVGEFNLTGSTTANTDATVTVSSTTNLKQGMSVTGTGIPSSTTVLTITSGTVFELSANATATGSANVTLTFNTQTLVIAGTNFQTGVTVTIDGTAPSTVTRNSSTQITVTGTPAKTAGTKVDGLVVTNLSGLSASINVDYSALPGWSSPASGNVGNFFITGSAISTIDLAGGADTTSYALTNSLPPGLSMSTSTGDITGTITGSTYTTYNFTVTATDAEAQSSPRLFNIITSALPTGGDISSPTGYRVHTYLADSSSSAHFVVASSITADVLVVAGGGSGGSKHGGGGGAGGVVYATGITLAAGSYIIDIGNGGIGRDAETGTSSATVWGDSGANSTFTVSGSATVLTALGGGAGGTHNHTVSNAAGGSSGGTWGHNGPTPPGATQSAQGQTSVDAGSSVVTNYGYTGGDNPAPKSMMASGGGGAGAVGVEGEDSGATGGTGGAGIQIAWITPDALGHTSGSGTHNGVAYNVGFYWAGGGAGAGYDTSNGVNSGGLGGGGGGASSYGVVNGLAGTGGLNAGTVGVQGGSGGNGGTNTGSGGGGHAQWDDSGTGGTGGSGIVVIRYAV